MSEDDIKWHKMIIRFPKDIVWYDKKRKIYWAEVRDPQKLVTGILATMSAEGKAVVMGRDEDE